MFTLPPLPYSNSALEPVFSAETLEYHHGKHFKAYIDKLNELVPDKENSDLPSLITSSSPWPIFNNAGQAYNHQLFFEQLQSPSNSSLRGGEADVAIQKLHNAIQSQRETFENFQSQFETSALSNFGSGRTRLVKTPDWNLEILNTSNAWNPLTDGKTPLLVVDVREHAYYIDYRNHRADYLKAFWSIVNWEIVNWRYSE